MRTKLIIILLLLTRFGLSQNGFFTLPDIDAALISLEDMVVDDDTIVIYGTMGKENPIRWGRYYAKFDTLGNLLEVSEIIADSVWLISSVYGSNLIKTPDGGYAIMGSYRVYNQDSSALKVYTYLMKVRHDLSLDFIKFYQNPGYKISLNYHLINYKSGYLLFASQQKAGEHGSNWFVRAVDATGEVLWKQSYYKPESYNQIRDVLVPDSNEIVILGNSRDNLPISAPPSDGFIYPVLMAIDSLGNEKWKWNWDGVVTGLRDNGKTFTQTPDGGFLIGGSRMVVIDDWGVRFNALITKLDSNFNIIWRHEIDTIPADNGLITSIVKTPDGHYLISGGTYTTYLMDNDTMVYGWSSFYHGKYDLDGHHQWERRDSGIVHQEFYYQGYVVRSALLSSGSIVSAGSCLNPEKDFIEWAFLIKLSPDGCLDTLNCWSVTDTKVVLPVADIQVYPNPTSGELTVDLGAGWPGNAYIHFYDLTGRLLRRQRLRNSHNVLDISDLPEGLLIYEVREGAAWLGWGKLIKN